MIFSRNPKFTIKIFAYLFALVMITGYSIFQARHLISGPQLSIDSPTQGETIKNSILEVAGSAHNISEIQLNDKQIYTEKDGRFKEKLMLSPGYNIMKVSVRDKFGREIHKTLEVVFDNNEIQQQARLNYKNN